MADTWGNDSDSSQSNPRAGDTPGFGTGGGGSVGGGGGYGVDRGGGLASGDGGRGGWESQGRGSNVTDSRPQSPAERAAGVGPGGAVNAAGPSPVVPIGLGQFPAGPTIPGVPLFMNPAPMAPTTIGVPTINLNLPNNPYGGAFIGQNIRTFENPNVGIGTSYYGNTGQPLTGSTGIMYREPQRAGFSQPLSAEVRQDYLNWLEKQNGLAPGSLSKQHAMESGATDNPDFAMSPTGALGAFQFTRGTAKSMGLINPLTGEDARTDFLQSADAAAALNVKNAEGLASFLGRQPTAAELSVAYQQGLGGAKALLGNPNLSAKEALAKAYGGDVEKAARAISVNGGDPDAPASQFTGKLTSAFNAMPSDLSKLAAYRGSPADLPAVSAKTALQSAGNNGFAVPGGQQTAAQAASSSPQNFGDWLSGLFDNNARIKELEAQGKTALFPDAYSKEFLTDEEGNPISAKEWYRQDIEQQLGRPVDISEVKSRIVDYGQGPVVDYYTKGLDQALGEIVTGPFKAIGNLFNQSSGASTSTATKTDTAKAASQNPDLFGAWLSGMFDNSAQVKQLESQGQTSTYPEYDVGYAKQKYADDFAGGDLSKVRSRVVDYGQGPVVDYYSKDLTEAFFGIPSLFGKK